MRTDIIRIYKDVHTWTGIVAGLALFIAFYAGAFTMLKEPLARWAEAPGTRAPGVPLAAAPTLIERALEARPGLASEFMLKLDEDDAARARLLWYQPEPEEEQEHGHVPQAWSATLDAAGQLQLQAERPAPVANLVDILHRTAGIPGDLELGMGIMGIVSALYALALVSGIIVLLPTLVQDFLALRVGPNLKRMWLDAHNAVGVVSLPFHLVMALSGLVFGLHDQFYEAQDEVVYDGRVIEHIRAHSPYLPPPARGEPAAMLPPGRLLALARERAPGFQPASLSYRHAGDAAASVLIAGSEPRYLLRKEGLLLLSAVDGSVLNDYYFPPDRNAWTVLVNSFFSLHYGSFGGEPVRWSYVLLGLAGAFLFYSGNLLWIESRRRRQRPGHPAAPQRRATRWMAAGTVGVCLGCIGGVSLTIAAAKWLPAWVEDRAAWHLGLYYALFLGAIAWSLRCGAARAAVHLLWLAAAVTWAIPASSLLGWLAPGSGPWAQGGSALLVDGMALTGGLALAAMARAAARRGARGAGDSVWSRREIGAEGGAGAGEGDRTLV